MRSKLRLAQSLVCCFSFTLPAIAQLDSAALRTKYGKPLNRETFHTAAGFDLVVDYGSNSQVCKLQVPALMPTTEQVSNTAEMKQRMYDFLIELVPESMRGKELRRMASVTSASASVSSIEYEHVTVSELQAGQPFGHDNAITVGFTNDNCRSAVGH